MNVPARTLSSYRYRIIKGTELIQCLFYAPADMKIICGIPPFVPLGKTRREREGIFVGKKHKRRKKTLIVEVRTFTEYLRPAGWDYSEVEDTVKHVIIPKTVDNFKGKWYGK